MDWIILTIFEYIFTFFVETASFEIVFPKGGCFIAQIIGRCYNANINKFLKEEQDMKKKVIGVLLVIIPGISEPPVRTLRATIPENERHIFR